MFNWIIKIISKPILPLLRQADRVLKAAEIALTQAIDAAVGQGIPETAPFVEKMRQILDAVTRIKTAVEKVIEFFGGEVSANCILELSTEVEALKKLM